MKIVINKCYGGFGLSEAAMMRYAKKKGFRLYKEDHSLSPTYWKIKEIPKRPNRDDYKTYEDYANSNELKSYNEKYDKYVVYYGDLERTDPTLIETIEELGEEICSGSFARLKIVEIPYGTEWHMTEYDGIETIRGNHKSW
jgi:hypothetical protein